MTIVTGLFLVRLWVVSGKLLGFWNSLVYWHTGVEAHPVSLNKSPQWTIIRWVCLAYYAKRLHWVIFVSTVLYGGRSTSLSNRSKPTKLKVTKNVSSLNMYLPAGHNQDCTGLCLTLWTYLEYYPPWFKWGTELQQSNWGAETWLRRAECSALYCVCQCWPSQILS